MTMEFFTRTSKWVVGIEQTKSGLRLPPIRGYMDDIATLTTTAACTKRLLGKLQENIEWAWMKIKPNKSCSISVVKEELKDVWFCIGDNPIPTIAEQHVKSLGRWYNVSLKVPITAVEKMGRTITSYAKKWLGVPQCLNNIVLYGKGVLELPQTGLKEEYKCSEMRLQMILKD